MIVSTYNMNDECRCFKHLLANVQLENIRKHQNFPFSNAFMARETFSITLERKVISHPDATKGRIWRKNIFELFIKAVNEAKKCSAVLCLISGGSRKPIERL